MNLYPKLNSINKENQFSVPEFYFEHLELKLFEKHFTEQENELEYFITLNNIPKQNCFVIDENYFARNENDLFTLLEEKQHVRIIDFVFSKEWLAAAAILVVSVGFGIYGYFFSTPENKDCGTMACVDKSELLKTRVYHRRIMLNQKY